MLFTLLVLNDQQMKDLGMNSFIGDLGFRFEDFRLRV